MFFRRIQSEKQRIFGTFRTFLSYSSLFNRFKPFLYFPCQSTQVLPKRWVVERTFAWLNGSRRLSKDYETSCYSAETMIMISHAATLLKRL